MSYFPDITAVLVIKKKKSTIFPSAGEEMAIRRKGETVHRVLMAVLDYMQLLEIDWHHTAGDEVSVSSLKSTHTDMHADQLGPLEIM